MPETLAQLTKAAAAKTWAFTRADVVRVIDPDNVELDVIMDVGFNDSVTRRRSFRLFGLNANESGDPGGREATANLTRLLPVGTRVRLESVKPDKFGGRYDAVLYANDVSVNQLLIDTHWAVPWNGKGIKPKPPWPRPEDA